MLPELVGNWGNMVPTVWPASARELVLGLRLVSATRLPAPDPLVLKDPKCSRDAEP